MRTAANVRGRAESCWLLIGLSCPLSACGGTFRVGSGAAALGVLLLADWRVARGEGTMADRELVAT